MRRLMVVCVVVASAFAASIAGATAAKTGTMCALNATLRAKNETPSTTSAAKGHTLVKVRADGTIEFKTHINNKVKETFIAGHIHRASVGVAGPIVVPLFVPPSPATSARQIKQSGTATPNPGTTGAALCQNPSAYYVNYHTTTFPGGAVRGQLH